MQCPDELSSRIDPGEIVKAIIDCRDALANDNSTQEIRSRLGSLRAVAIKLCKAFCRLEAASDFWTALNAKVEQRDPYQQADIQALGSALETLRPSHYSDLAEALRRWGFSPPGHAITFVEEQMGQLFGAVISTPVSLPHKGGKTLGALPSHAKAAVRVMKEQVCEGEENYEKVAGLRILRGKVGEFAVKGLIEFFKKKLGVLFGIAMIFASSKQDCYESDNAQLSADATHDALLLLGLMCVVFNGTYEEIGAPTNLA